MNKIYPDAASALAGIVRDGQLMAVGGFGLCGIPEALIDALQRYRVFVFVETRVDPAIPTGASPTLVPVM